MNDFTELIIDYLTGFLKEIKEVWMQRFDDEPVDASLLDEDWKLAYKGQYSGSIKDGYPDGLGRYITPEGDTYVGHFFRGERHGIGILTRAGSSYHPEYFEELIKNDRNVVPKGTEEYIGQWQADKRYGFGVQTWKDGDQYKGWWIGNMRQGEGTYYAADGWHIDGEWVIDFPYWGKYKPASGAEIKIIGFDAEDAGIQYKPILLSRSTTTDEYGHRFIFLARVRGYRFTLGGDELKLNTAGKFWLEDPPIGQNWIDVATWENKLSCLSPDVDLEIPDDLIIDEDQFTKDYREY